MIDYLLNFSSQPIWIFFAIILSSYILEDMAIIAAALLATEQLISIPMAASAIMFGIISGDIGLYIIGHSANKHDGIKRKLLSKGRHQRYTDIFNNNLLKNILLIRFIPGLRFVCYTSCGLLKIHPGRFILGITVATALWVSVVFSIIYILGSNAWTENSHWKWALIPVAMLMLYLLNRHYMQNLKPTQQIDYE